MGCNNIKCSDPNELNFTCTLNGTQTLVSSLNVSNGSTKPSLSTEVKAKFMFETSTDKFHKVKTLANLYLQKYNNFLKLQEIIGIWEIEVYDKLRNSMVNPGDLNLKVEIDSQENQFIIIIEADGLRKFDPIKSFCFEVERFDNEISSAFSYKKFQENVNFLSSLSPLTITFYLSLGEKVDCGIGVNKPLDRKSLTEFLSDSSERLNISRWCYSAGMPIPISVQFSCFTQEKGCTFYIFDGDKDGNYSRGFTLFEYFVGPIPDDIRELLSSAGGEEVKCSLSFENNGVKSLSMGIKRLPSIRSIEIGKAIGDGFNPERWSAYAYLLGSNTEISINLTPNGLVMKRIADL
ncbi:unnamed protein product [Blepharisma stoltei]|uniref:Uncharacterized protein n=1 Tax=Blepharisma stoltei TaxID=1481888 RepID=A0AAU9K666_9CILI|nr:unnamed protein product [Blepharisma stoltei]